VRCRSKLPRPTTIVARCWWVRHLAVPSQKNLPQGGVAARPHSSVGRAGNTESVNPAHCRPRTRTQARVTPVRAARLARILGSACGSTLRLQQDHLMGIPPPKSTPWDERARRDDWPRADSFPATVPTGVKPCPDESTTRALDGGGPFRDGTVPRTHGATAVNAPASTSSNDPTCAHSP